MQILRNIGLALSLGAVFFTFSESLFWSFWKPTDTAGELFATYIFYSLATYAFLIFIEKFKVHTINGLLLCGALYGWLIEGFIVPEVYTMLPFSLVFTALSWHMVITILFVYYWLSKRLAMNQSALPALIGLGVLWGVYAIFPGSDPESGDWVFTTYAFFTHTLFTTATWLVGFYAYNRLHPSQFKATKFEMCGIGIVFVALYGLQVYNSAFLGLALLPFLMLTFYVLHGRKNSALPDENILMFWSEPIGVRRILMVCIPGIVATLTFGFVYPLTGPQDIAWPFFIGTVFLAIYLYGRALWKR